MANRYFMGQGTVKIGTRDGAGAPVDLRSIGNCPSLNIEVSEEFSEHFESETGDRRMDIKIRTSLKVDISFTIESFDLANWLMAYNGTAGTGGVGEEVIEAFNATRVDYYMKFEGMNTLESKNPITVNLFKVDLSPPSSLSLISEDLVGLEMTGSVLYDDLNSAQGGYFTITQQAL